MKRIIESYEEFMSNFLNESSDESKFEQMKKRFVELCKEIGGSYFSEETKSGVRFINNGDSVIIPFIELKNQLSRNLNRNIKNILKRKGLELGDLLKKVDKITSKMIAEFEK